VKLEFGPGAVCFDGVAGILRDDPLILAVGSDLVVVVAVGIVERLLGVLATLGNGRARDAVISVVTKCMTIKEKNIYHHSSEGQHHS